MDAVYLFFVTGMLKEVAELFGRWALHDSVPRRPWPASRAPFRFFLFCWVGVVVVVFFHGLVLSVSALSGGARNAT